MIRSASAQFEVRNFPHLRLGKRHLILSRDAWQTLLNEVVSNKQTPEGEHQQYVQHGEGHQPEQDSAQTGGGAALGSALVTMSRTDSRRGVSESGRDGRTSSDA